jgi:hypothetical protein
MLQKVVFSLNFIVEQTIGKNKKLKKKVADKNLPATFSLYFENQNYYFRLNFCESIIFPAAEIRHI